MTKYDFELGDWVCVPNSDEPTKVTALEDDYLRVEGFFSDQAYGCIEPIPITPEILEKNGFKVYTIDKVTFCKCENVTINMSYESIWCHIEIFGCTLSHYGIKYVHELQHALRLCKIDKEIEL